MHMQLDVIESSLKIENCSTQSIADFQVQCISLGVSDGDVIDLAENNKWTIWTCNWNSEGKATLWHIYTHIFLWNLP